MDGICPILQMLSAPRDCAHLPIEKCLPPPDTGRKRRMDGGFGHAGYRLRVFVTSSGFRCGIPGFSEDAGVLERSPYLDALAAFAGMDAAVSCGAGLARKADVTTALGGGADRKVRLRFAALAAKPHEAGWQSVIGGSKFCAVREGSPADERACLAAA